MIRIKIQTNQGKFKKITFSGHALYADYGKDIVCAGVSSILTTTINGILRIDESALDYHQKKDGLELNIGKTDEITQKLIENMICLFEELKSTYPKNIKIESEEKTC